MPEEPQRFSEVVVLLVEDRKMDIELTLDAFEAFTLTNAIQVVRTGAEALDYLFGRGKFEDRAQFPLPDLILLDLNLPGVDGLTVLRELKSTPIIKRIPVVILTSSRQEYDRAKCYDEGANSYLIKPVSFESFTRVVGDIKNYWLTLNVEPPLDNVFRRAVAMSTETSAPCAPCCFW